MLKGCVLGFALVASGTELRITHMDLTAATGPLLPSYASEPVLSSLVPQQILLAEQGAARRDGFLIAHAAKTEAIPPVSRHACSLRFR